MTKPNRRAGLHRSYAQIILFPLKFYGPLHVLPKSQKNEKEMHWGRTSMAVGEDLNGSGGACEGGVRCTREPQRRARVGGAHGGCGGGHTL
jgi:hypothetical protein